MKADSFYTAAIVILVLMLFVLIGVVVYAFRPINQGVTSVSQLVLSPTPTTVLSPTPEPTILVWRTYDNRPFLFSLEVPQEWKEQDYARSFPSGGTIVAFSENTLPCETCTYFKNGYFSVQVYNNATHPDKYKRFVEKVAAIGKVKGYQGVMIDGKPGVFFENVVSVEHQGWVYDIVFEQYSKTTNPLDSKIYMRALTSFRFTGIEFSR